MILRTIFLLILIFIFVHDSSWPIQQEKKRQLNLETHSLFKNQEIPRTILALYKGSETPTGIAHHPLHRFIEMPLNHLGLKVSYWDITKGLPDISKYSGLRGIVSWYLSDDMENPSEYLKWASKAIESGYKFLIIGPIGAERNKEKKSTPLYEINQLIRLLGVDLTQNWLNIPYDVSYSSNFKDIINFEQKLPRKTTGVPYYRIISSQTIPILSITSEIEGEISIPIICYNPNGGIANDNFFISINQETSLARWYIDPFYYLAHVFDTHNLPKPDTTTLSGKRLYFSHIDGDGWISISQISEFRKNQTLCAEVIMKKAIEPYPDLPVTVAPIAADLDLEWHGTKKAQEIARKIFELPQVEPASHTYSHPLYWAYYNKPDAAEKEIKEFGLGKKKFLYETEKKNAKNDIGGYALPRAFLEKPFDITKELIGSCAFIQQFSPSSKKISLLQWSGDCEPFENAVTILRQSKLRNMNGGDSRFDEEFPSYSSVAPIGREIGQEVQIYATNSNENTYTNNWTERFFGYKFLKKTFENTEFPIRVKAANIYYHMYSGEKESSLNALLGNLDFIRIQDITPIEASFYAAIADGFFQARFIEIAPMTWRIENHDRLQTIRFDNATDLQIDWQKSEGIIGAKHFQGSLYIALDEAIIKPVIALQKTNINTNPSLALRPYLLESNWHIWDFKNESPYFQFKAKGYGKPSFHWIVPKSGKYEITIEEDNKKTQIIEVNDDQNLKINLDLTSIKPMFFAVKLIE